MEGAQVGVLIEANKVGLGRLLEGKHRGSLEAKAILEVLGDSWRASTEDPWKRRFFLKSWAISRQRRWKGNLRIRRSVDFW